MPRLMSVQEIAEYLQVTEKTIYRLIEQGEIPAAKVGRQWRFDQGSIDVWLHQGQNEANANILVIDDDETICSLFKDTLNDAGHTVTTVGEAYKGLELVKNQDYDLVFIDLKLPGMDGAELFGQIRRVKPELPVTIITGYPDSDLMTRALDFGPLGVIKKPFHGSDILTAVQSTIRFGVRK